MTWRNQAHLSVLMARGEGAHSAESPGGDDFQRDPPHLSNSYVGIA